MLLDSMYFAHSPLRTGGLDPLLVSNSTSVSCIFSNSYAYQSAHPNLIEGSTWQSGLQFLKVGRRHGIFIHPVLQLAKRTSTTISTFRPYMSLFRLTMVDRSSSDHFILSECFTVLLSVQIEGGTGGGCYGWCGQKEG